MNDFDFDMPRFNDDGAVLPNAEPFPATAADGESPAAGKPRPSSQARENEESSESAQAPVRRRRPRPRTMPFDQRMELHNSDLASWKQEYLANMATASVTKRNHHAAFAAKRNATMWVTGVGIGGVGAGIGSNQTASPLDMFTGDAMMQMLTGIDLNASRKRALSADSDGHTGSEARRRRLRESDEEEIGRGDNVMLADDDLGFANIDVLAIIHRPTFTADCSLRTSKLAVKPRLHLLMTPLSLGIPLPPPLHLAMALLSLVDLEPRVLGDFPAVSVGRHRYKVLSPAHLIAAAIESRAPAPLPAVALPDTAA